jgi:hypothetical protein
MNAFANPFASSPTKRVPLIYENLKMLERECDLTKEDSGILTRFCGKYPPRFQSLLAVSLPPDFVPAQTASDFR